MDINGYAEGPVGQAILPAAGFQPALDVEFAAAGAGCTVEWLPTIIFLLTEPLCRRLYS